MLIYSVIINFGCNVYKISFQNNCLFFMKNLYTKQKYILFRTLEYVSLLQFGSQLKSDFFRIDRNKENYFHSIFAKNKTNDFEEKKTNIKKKIKIKEMILKKEN